jgi:hypothetical protein
MGILKPQKPSSTQAAPTTKGRSIQGKFADLKPLKPGGALSFTGMRDNQSPREKNCKGKDADDMESDEDELPANGLDKLINANGEEYKSGLLSLEDANRQGELADGVKKMKVCSF